MLELEVTLTWGNNPLWTRHYPARRSVTVLGVTIAWPEITTDGHVSWIDDAHALVTSGDLTLAVSVAPRERLAPCRAPLGDVPMALSFVAHLVALGSLAHYRPVEEARPERQLLAMRAYLDRTPANEPTEHDVTVSARNLTWTAGATHEWVPTGSNSAGARRAVGDEAAPATREAALAEASGFGVIGLLAPAAQATDGTDDTWQRPGGGTAGLWSADGDLIGAGLGPLGMHVGGAGDGAGVGTGNTGTFGFTSGSSSSWNRYGGRYESPYRLHCHRWIRDGVVMARGALFGDVVERVVHVRHPSLLDCKEVPSARELDIAFVVGRDGEVVGVREGGAGECVRHVLASLTFPSSDGVTSVRYPMTFGSTCS